MADALPALDSVARVNPPPSVLVCSWTDGGPDAAWVHVAGELDLATVPQLVRTLRESQLHARLVVLDLRELDFMDSSGAHAIVNASIRARRLGGRLVLLRAPPNTDRMSTLTGSSNDAEIGDLDQVEPPVQEFVQPRPRILCIINTTAAVRDSAETCRTSTRSLSG